MTYDVVIIGAGHNGLVCAFYLASAGLKVKMLERRHIVGGAAVTEEFHPGFRNSTASYTVSLLNPKVIRDMDLHGHGLRIVERRASNFIPQPDGRYLLIGAGRTKEEIAKFSAKDAARYDDYSAEIDDIADVLRSLVLKVPPNVTEGGWLTAIPEMLRAASVGSDLRKLPMQRRRALFDLFTKSAADYLDHWFENDAVKGIFGFDATVGAFCAPSTPGTAYVQLHHCFGEVNGKKGAWGHAIGGMGAITEAMRKACTAKGVEIEVSAPVSEVIVEKNRAVGVRLEDGRTIKAKRVASNLNPRLLYEKLVPEAALPSDFLHRMKRWKCGSGSFRMNVALSELPSFSCLPGHELQDHHASGIYIAPTLSYMEQAYHDAREHGWSKKPIVEMMISSTLDDSLAPKGAHVASLFCQYVSPDFDNAHRDTFADLIIKTIDSYAPGFEKSVIARQIHAPKDLEDKFGLVGGDIFHGALSLDQLYSARPMLGYADHRSPIKGLYTCGAGTHPGGGVTGAPGHNAAGIILADARRGA
ncbi:MAG: NAD(P)/FAD-dependent oxidoreductase [Rhizobiales bacterium]|nr:NAD(P)/FAD-dependent oxidoreductase [Hyphomicrobiales bacterium]